MRIALGCMRLSTESARDDQRGLDTLEAALDAGVTIFDTARSYAIDERELGHNEKLVAQALKRRPGVATRVITKCGMRRDGGAWLPDGRARTILEDALASVEALDGVPIDVLLLHAPDPRVSIATSARALARVQEAGLARSVGVSNVSRKQLEEAAGEAPITAVEVALGAHDDVAIRGGVVGFCIERGIEIFAHSPLGGPERARRLARDPELARIAASLQASAIDVFLAYLLAVRPEIVPIVGARRAETAGRIARAAELVLDTDQLAALDARFSALGRTRSPPRALPDAAGDAEVVLVMGVPGSGKSRAARVYLERGYERLNRDLESADGSLLLAQSVLNGATSYELVANGPTPMPTAAAGQNGSWVGLYPDGSAALSMSTVIDVARAAIFGGFSGGSGNATLYDTKTGQAIPSMGIPPGVLMPFFSPDGSYLVFNDYAIEDAHGIALLRYDPKTHTASDYTVLVKEPPGAMRPAWPFVLPDNGGVVFVRTDDFDFTGGGVGVSGDIAPGAVAPFAELSIIDLGSKTVTLLARAMGYNTPEDAAKNVSYLPFGQQDLHHAYYPTVSPVGSGGYFWVFFDSIRHYGVLGLQRQLWGAAIEISHDGTYARDPSYPAFYVSGQEFGTGNHRAFAALDPCRKDGDTCTSGIDCCGGFCYIESAAELVEPVGKCTPERPECSNKDERCTTDADCCAPPDGQPPYSCIAGFCAYVTGPG